MRFLNRLSCCGITEEGCVSLASALKSNPSHLRELDLSFNYPGESGVKLLSERLLDPECSMEKLMLVSCWTSTLSNRFSQHGQILKPHAPVKGCHVSECQTFILLDCTVNTDSQHLL